MTKNKFNFGFMNKLMLKDLDIISQQIKTNKINLPVTKKIRLYYQMLVNRGYEKEDTSNLIRLLKR
jgi:3-hydroxyisobutyrate dehydrogenase-like beta-hydroxyacid dehydrogenase